MDQFFELWIYRGLIAILLVIVWYVVKKFTAGILTKIDIVIQKLSDLALSNNTHEERITNLIEADKQFAKRLDDHAIRIRKIETKQSACRVCKTETE
jgi:hypothetical protein